MALVQACQWTCGICRKENVKVHVVVHTQLLPMDMWNAEEMQFHLKRLETQRFLVKLRTCEVK